MEAYYLNKIQQIKKLKDSASQCEDIDVLRQISKELQYDEQMFIDTTAEAQIVRKAYERAITDIELDVQHLRLMSVIQKDIHSPLPGLGCKPEITAEKLGKIFDKLMRKGIVLKNEKKIFISIFTPQALGSISWNTSIPGAKSGLFDLVERITGLALNTKTLKLYFRADGIRDGLNSKSPTKLIDEIFV